MQHIGFAVSNAATPALNLGVGRFEKAPGNRLSQVTFAH